MRLSRTELRLFVNWLDDIEYLMKSCYEQYTKEDRVLLAKFKDYYSGTRKEAVCIHEHDEKDIKPLIEACLDQSDKLNEWEYGFINTLYGQETMTVKQYRKLMAIWERISVETD